MANSTYQINKGINKSIVFKGLKGQYIWYMGGGMFLLLILYAGMYMAKVNTYLSLGIMVCMGAAMMMGIYHLSSTYGEHGLTKTLAKRSIPKVVKSNSRKVFRTDKKVIFN
ncbi:MAG: DUF4133 domain-containing protein [Dyadobacter sp.]